MNPEDSAEWVIGRIHDYLEPFGGMVPDGMYRLSRTPVRELHPNDRQLARLANNLGVDSIRTMIEIEKGMGALQGSW